MHLRAGILLILISMMVATRVQAQSLPTPVQIRGAAGYLHALEPELEYGALALLASLRVPLTPLISFEPEVGHSRDTNRETFPLVTVPGAVAETRLAQTSWSIGANVVAARSSGRLRPFGGGGVGVYWERSNFSTFVPAGSPNAGTFRMDRSSGARFGAQGMAGVDLAISKRVALFGAFRAEVRAVWESAVLITSGLAGARFAIP